MKKLILFIFSLISAIIINAQNYCPENDSCWGAIEVPICTPIYFCNDSCNYDFYEATSEIEFPPGDPYMNNIVGPWDTECHYINYDQWFEFTYPLTSDGYLSLDIWNGTCEHPEGAVGNYGPLEGWAMMVWQGDECNDTSELVWSTNCYWMTEAEVNPQIGPDDWIGITDFDPTRQEWYITITNAIPGQHYFIQIDSFGWCVGCGWFQWCDAPIFLELTNPPPTIESMAIEEIRVDPPWKVTNILGQTVPIEYNQLLIFYYKNGSSRIVVIQN
tara:strand:+ start:867 stop:1685 length:819 start_codon:yes stop_codon:yes gene_type:complete